MKYLTFILFILTFGAVQGQLDKDTVLVHMNHIYFNMDVKGLNEFVLCNEGLEIERIYDPQTDREHYCIRREINSDIEDIKYKTEYKP